MKTSQRIISAVLSLMTGILPAESALAEGLEFLNPLHQTMGKMIYVPKEGDYALSNFPAGGAEAISYSFDRNLGTNVTVDKSGTVKVLPETANDTHARVRATADGETIQSQMFYTYKYFFDFENGKATYPISKAKVITEDNGNKYAYYDSNYINVALGTQWLYEGIYVIRCDMLLDGYRGLYAEFNGGISHALVNYNPAKGTVTTGSESKAVTIDEGWHHINAIIDMDSYTYTVFCDDKLISEIGEDIPKLSKDVYTPFNRLQVYGGIDNFGLHSSALACPIVYDIELGEVKAGKVIAPKYKLFGDGKGEADFRWLVADSYDGEYEIAGTGNTFTPGVDMAGKFLKVTANTKNGELSGFETVVTPVEIKDVDKLNVTATEGKETVLNIGKGMPEEDIFWSIDSTVSGVTLSDSGILRVSEKFEDELTAKAVDKSGKTVAVLKLKCIDGCNTEKELSDALLTSVFNVGVNTGEITEISVGSIKFAVSPGEIQGVKTGEIAEFKFVADDGKYYAFADGNIIAWGEFEEDIKKISADSEFEYYYAGSPVETEGAFLNCIIDDEIYENLTLLANYEFYNECGIYPEEFEVLWYIDGEIAGQGESFTVPKNTAEKDIYYEVITGKRTIKSKSITIKKEYTYSFENGIFKINWNFEKDGLYVFLKDSKGKLYFKELKDSSVEFELPHEEYTVFFVLKDNLSPYEMPFNPETGKDIEGCENAFSCFVMKPENSDNVVSAFSESYSLGDLKAELEKGNKEIIEDIYFSGSETMPEEYENKLLPGVYNFIFTDQTGKSVEKIFYSKENIIFENAENFTLTGFGEVIKKVLGIENSDSIMAMLESLADKNDVVTLTAGNKDWFVASVYAVSLTEGSEYNKESGEKLMEELKKLGITSKVCEFLADTEFYKEAMAEVKKDKDLINTLKAIEETVVLKEVELQFNYKNIKKYLKEIGSESFNGASETVQNKVCSAVYKKKFESVSDLKNAVENAIKEADSQSTNKGTSSGGGGGGGNAYLPPEKLYKETDSKDDNPKESDSQFLDVTRSHWAYQYILDMNNKNIINGYEGNFRPDSPITRAEFVKILVSAIGAEIEEKCSFDDVAENAWYYKYVATAEILGIIKGNGKEFFPDRNISRQDAAVMIFRALNLKEGGNVTFSDKAEISDYALTAVASLSSAGIINGMGDNTFKPKGMVTRAETAKMISVSLKHGGEM